MNLTILLPNDKNKKHSLPAKYPIIDNNLVYDETILFRFSYEFEFIEKKSRFLGFAIPINSEEACLSCLNIIRKKYYDARHACYAYVYGESGQYSKCSDDGEPSGTAGKPILDVIRGNNLTDTMIVVVRYFGGVLLGTGGLVRAYSEAAKLALAGIKKGNLCLGKEIYLHTSYSDYDKVRYVLETNGCALQDVTYSENVSARLLLEEHNADTIEKLLLSITDGRINFSSENYSLIVTSVFDFASESSTRK
jgi:uncharacterized YigZ family protein